MIYLSFTTECLNSGQFLATLNIAKGRGKKVKRYKVQIIEIIEIFFKAVKKYFCIQSTSCSAERTFSTGDSTVTAKRNKLDPINVNMIFLFQRKYEQDQTGQTDLEKQR